MNQYQTADAAFRAAEAIITAAEAEDRDLTKIEAAEFDATIARFEQLRDADALRTQHAGVIPSATGGITLARALFGDPTERRDLFAYSTGGTAVTRTEYAPVIWEHLAGQSVVLNLPGITRYTTTESTFSFTGGTSFVTAAAVAEGGTASPADPGYVRNVITPAKYVASRKVSEEFWADAGEPIRAQIATNLVRSLGLQISKDLLEGSGSPGIEGIASLSGVGTVDASGGTATNLSFFAQAMSTAMAANASPTAWVMAPEMYRAMVALTEGTASNRPLLTPSSNAGGAVAAIGADHADLLAGYEAERLAAWNRTRQRLADYRRRRAEELDRRLA